jgi:hypothetical protein
VARAHGRQPADRRGRFLLRAGSADTVATAASIQSPARTAGTPSIVLAPGGDLERALVLAVTPDDLQPEGKPARAAARGNRDRRKAVCVTGSRTSRRRCSTGPRAPRPAPGSSRSHRTRRRGRRASAGIPRAAGAPWRIRRARSRWPRSRSAMSGGERRMRCATRSSAKLRTASRAMITITLSQHRRRRAAAGLRAWRPRRS